MPYCIIYRGSTTQNSEVRLEWVNSHTQGMPTPYMSSLLTFVWSIMFALTFSLLFLPVKSTKWMGKTGYWCFKSHVPRGGTWSASSAAFVHAWQGGTPWRTANVTQGCHATSNKCFSSTNQHFAVTSGRIKKIMKQLVLFVTHYYTLHTPLCACLKVMKDLTNPPKYL